jgi:Clp amino terminal domain, pathogenicity island component
MFERFTRPARESVFQAQGAARRLGDDQIGVEHLLLGLLAEEESVAAVTLAELGVTAEGVERELAAIRGLGRLGPAEAEALLSIGIDLEAIRRRVEASFGRARWTVALGGGVATSPSPSRPRRRSSWACERRSRCGTGRSARSTCCSA